MKDLQQCLTGYVTIYTYTGGEMGRGQDGDMGQLFNMYYPDTSHKERKANADRYADKESNQAFRL